MHSLVLKRRRLLIGLILLLAPAWVLLTGAIPAHAQRKAPAFKVTQGATDDQVFQRNDNNQADIALSGTATLRGAARVRARIQRRHVTVTGFEWKDIANVAKGGAWKATLKGLRVGGPYDVDLQLVDRKGSELAATSIRSLLVGDLWILAGQSNMAGAGNLVNTEPTSDIVHSFDMRDEWIVAEEPLHWLPDSADPVHWRHNEQGEPVRTTGKRAADYRKNRTRGAGLGLPFAIHMVQRTGVPIGLVPCAHGGTSMSQWNPALRDQGGKSLYGAMVRRHRAVGGKVKGVLWYQGESDAGEEAAPLFGKRFRDFIGATRSDFNQSDLPFYLVQLGRYVTNQLHRSHWDLVQEEQRLTELKLTNTGVVAGVDLELDDRIHIGTDGLKVLGHRMANLACHDLFPEVAECRNLQRGPRPVSATLDKSKRRVRVAFSDVNGTLRAPGRVTGFSLLLPDGNETRIIYRTSIDPAAPNTVILKLQGELPEGTKLWYGRGLDPHCNLTDEADMAAPAFGPMEIK